MKTTILAVALSAFASLCAAQAQASLPDCAQKCVIKFTSGDSIGGCQSQAIACICSAPTFLSDIACCLSTACNAADQQAATDFARNYCELAGVTNLPTAVVCTSNSSSATKSAPTGGSSSTPGSSTSGSSSSSITPAPTPAGSTPTPPATTSKPNAGAQQTAAVGAGLGLLALAALL